MKYKYHDNTAPIADNTQSLPVCRKTGKTTDNIAGKTARRLLALAVAIMLIFTGCAGSQTSTDSSTSSVAGTSAETGSATAYDAASKSDMFTERDISGEYDEAAALRISLDGTSASITSEGTDITSAGVSIDGSTITISQEGTYIFSGTLADGMIIVDADDSAKVQIVLSGADITSKTSAALYVKSADKVFVTAADGTENALANGGTFTAIDDSNIDGAVFAKDDITFNGRGNLKVTSPAGHGIVGKDDVKIAGGILTITAAKHGIQANDSARFTEADVMITAGTDGVHVSDNSDAEEGTVSDSYFYIADASMTIEAGDDGIHADAQALIEGGSIKVTKSYEGIEALDIEIIGGDIAVNATDDGLNAAGGNSAGTEDKTFGEDDWYGNGHGGFSDGGTDGSIKISGGNTHVTAGGDGIDSNGSLEISGGTTVVEGPSQGDTSVLDFNSTGTISGGVFIGTGGAGMAQNFSSAEGQGLIAVSVGSQSAGTTITLKDSDGNVVAEQTPELDYSVLYISTPDVKQGGTYTLTAGTYTETIELTDTIYSNISGGFGGRGGRGPHGNMKPSDGSTDTDTGATEMQPHDRMRQPEGNAV